MARKRPTLHPRATTTRAQRRRMKMSEKSDRALAAEMGKNVNAIAKWRKRRSSDDGSRGQSGRQNTFSVPQRKRSWLSFARPQELPSNGCAREAASQLTSIPTCPLSLCSSRRVGRTFSRGRLPIARRRTARPRKSVNSEFLTRISALSTSLPLIVRILLRRRTQDRAERDSELRFKTLRLALDAMGPSSRRICLAA